MIEVEIVGNRLLIKSFDTLATSAEAFSAPAVKAIESGTIVTKTIGFETEQKYTLGLAYPAMKTDVAVAADGHIDFVSAEVLEKTAWAWMTDPGDINLFHKGGTEGHAKTVESYIYRGPDWKVNDCVIKSGDWMLGTVWDDHG